MEVLGKGLLLGGGVILLIGFIAFFICTLLMKDENELISKEVIILRSLLLITIGSLACLVGSVIYFRF